MGCGSGDLTLYFQDKNIELEKSIKCENISLENGDEVRFCFYHNPTQPLENQSTVLDGFYMPDTEMALNFYISLSPPPYQETALNMIKQVLSTFAFISYEETIDAEGFKTYSGVASSGRQPFTFKYPSNYILSYEYGEYKLTDKNNVNNLITITADNINNPTSYSEILSTIKQDKNYTNIEEFQNGTFISGIKGHCAPESNKCDSISMIIVKYAQASATINISDTVLKKDVMVIANSFKDIE